MTRGTNAGVSEIRCEVLVIGSEAAGARAAIEAREKGADVLVVSKGLVGRSGNTVMAGCLVQAPLGHMDPRDNPDVFFEDVVRGGAYLNNQKLVERLVRLSVTEVPRMEEWGARFLKKGEHYLQIQVPGSSYPRSLHTVGHRGGPHWRKALGGRLQRLGVRLMEDVFVTFLVLAKGPGWPDIDPDGVEREKGKIAALFERRTGVRGHEVKNRIKDIMWERCSLVRDEQNMNEGLRAIQAMKERDILDLHVPDPSPIHNKGLVEALEAAGMTDLAEMTVRAALMRRESRGSHYRTDFPGRDDEDRLGNIVIRSDGSGGMTLETRKPVMTKMQPLRGGEAE